MTTIIREYKVRCGDRRAECYTMPDSVSEVAVFFSWRKSGGRNFMAVTNKLYLSWDEAVQEANAWVTGEAVAE